MPDQTDRVIKLSEILEILPDGLFIKMEAKKQRKRYCIGQPQLKYGKFYFSNKIAFPLQWKNLNLLNFQH